MKRPFIQAAALRRAAQTSFAHLTISIVALAAISAFAQTDSANAGDHHYLACNAPVSVERHGFGNVE